MKVLWVSSFPKNGIGHKVFLEKQLTEMAEKTMTVDIFSTGSLYSVMKFLTTRRRLKELAQNYDLVHAQWGSGCGFLVSTIPGIKVITLRGSDWYGSGGVGKLPNRFREFIGSLLTKVSLRKFSQVIVVSNRMSDDIGPIFLIDAQHFTQGEHRQFGRKHLGEVDLGALPLHIIE